MSEETTPPTQSRPPRKRHVRILSALAWFVVLASYLAVLFAYVFPQDFRNSSPAYVWAAWTAFMIRTFLFHLGLLLCLITVLALLVHCWRLLIAILPLAAFSVGPDLWSCLPKRPPPVTGETVTVMSANLFRFNRNTDPIVAEVLAAQPDLLFLQEYAPHWHAAFSQALAADYPYAHHVVRDDCFGMAIYSRRPFVGTVNMALPLGEFVAPQARAVVHLAGRDVALYNVHLWPPKGRLRATERRREFADLLDHLQRETLPIVLCGDFNFTNNSPFAAALARLGLTDAQRISGCGRGSTWPVKGSLRYLPALRLDHVFLSEDLAGTSCRTGVGRGSDHRPVIAEIGFNANVPD